MNKFLVTACIFGLLLSSAFAQEKSPEQLREEDGHIWGIDGLKQTNMRKIVPTAANTRVGFWYNTNPDCTARGEINVRVVNAPEHGTTEISKVGDYVGYAKDSRPFKCNQHKTQGVQLKYKSADKYVGKDAVDVLVIFEDGYAMESHIDIYVR